MEGNYLPKEYRAKIVNEIRNTHFELGGRNRRVEMKTTNSQNFKGLRGEQVRSVNNGNLSHVHCLVDRGENVRKKENQSEFNSKYRSYTEEGRIKPLKPTSNLVVGTSTGCYITTASKAFKKYGEQGVKSYKDYISANKRHHFEIGSGERIDSQTQIKWVKKEEKKKKEKEKLSMATDKEIKGKYTKSPEFGEKGGMFVPTSFQDFKEHKAQGPSIQQRTGFGGDHIEFNQLTPGLSTTSQVFYSPKTRLEGSPLSKAKIDDLKSSHLNFGSSPKSYLPSSYQQVPEHKPIEIRKSSNSPTSVRIAQDQKKKKTYDTDYSSNYIQRPKSELRSTMLRKNPENWSQIVLGEEPQKMTTQAHSAFKPSKDSPPRLPPDSQKSLKSSHITLGNDYSATLPVSSDYNKHPLNSYSPSPHQKGGYDKMQTSNWNFGKFGSVTRSSVQQEYQWRGGSPGRVEKNNGLEQKKSHLNVGLDKNVWNSNYSSAYGWVQPVPDMNYRISLMN